MSIVGQVYAVTSKLHQLLITEEPDSEKRDDVIEQIEQLLEDRQCLLDEMKGPYSDEEKQLGNQIIEYNKVIDVKLAKLRLVVQADMNKLKKQKNTNEKYVNPYKNVNFDGMFFDKKK
ncbi:flagellar protein FliT [Bacillus suaedaesalsae]|uniref:Flagellar protein FliT n=1 Tax=Bacillus suaedaesalsae TaxID=2810349 RepID=A0ABS2DCX3_9BACI|nr:flagellar protein FliT [Bacillus suaedaesalsae]MBM6616314.1 flagellar protein FliT [Bacillus suaedaesalsae]